MLYNNLFVVVYLIVYLSVCRFVNALEGINGTQQKVQIKKLTDECMTCICEGLSKCDPGFECKGQYCGMFKITKSYWSKSGKPVMEGDTPDEKYAFSKCATYPLCARETIRNYMAKYAKDCNNDGVIDCLDYASVHMLGPYKCNGQLHKTFKKRFDSCQAIDYELSEQIMS